MPKTKLLTAMFLITALFALNPKTVLAESMTIQASSDAVVSSYNDPDAGDGGNLHVLKQSSGGSYNYALTLLKFDVSGIPENASISSATLKLFATLYETDGDSSSIEIDRNLQNWSEGSVFWANKPSSLYLNESASIAGTIIWRSWDVTDTVKGWKDDDFDNYGFKLRPGDDLFEAKFSSSERNSNQPYILVNYELAEEEDDVEDPEDLDSTPPVISNVTTHDVTANSARITWNTNEPAQSRVEYGDFSTTESYRYATSLVTSHEINLADLTANTSYIYAVLSTDAADNRAVASVFTFSTLPIAEGDPPPDTIDPSPETEAPTTTTAPATNTEQSGNEETSEEGTENTTPEANGTVSPGLLAKLTIVYDNSDYFLLGLLILILIALVILILKKKKSKDSPTKEQEEPPQKEEEKSETDESEKGHISVLVLLAIIVTVFILVLSYKIYNASQSPLPVEESQETVETVPVISYHDPSGNTDPPKPNDLTQGIICESTVLKVDLQLFEKGWDCRGEDRPEVNGGSIRITSDIFNINISNLGRGGFCGMGEDSVCMSEDYPLTRNIVNSTKYTDGESGEIFARIGSAEGPWISITHEDIGQRDLTETEKTSLFRVLQSIQIYE